MFLVFVLALYFYSPATSLHPNDSSNYQVASTNQTTSLKQKIKGVWTDGETDNAAFAINDKTIQYVDKLETYKYSLSGNKMTIFYTHNTLTFKVNVKNDTLTMYSQTYGLSTYWRFKN